MSSESNRRDDLEYASLWTRFGGLVVDNIFLAILVLPVAILPDIAAAGYLFIWFIFALFYILLLEGLWNNQTVGKYVLNMKVAKDDGSPADILDSLVRNTIGVIGQAFGWIGLVVGAFAIYQSNENKRLGDSIAGTIVITT